MTNPILAIEAGVAAIEMFAVVFIYFFAPRKDPDMAVIAAIQNELNALPGNVKQAIDAVLANSPLPPGAASAQDVSDTVQAVHDAVAAAATTQP